MSAVSMVDLYFRSCVMLAARRASTFSLSLGSQSSNPRVPDARVKMASELGHPSLVEGMSVQSSSTISVIMFGGTRWRHRYHTVCCRVFVGCILPTPMGGGIGGFCLGRFSMICRSPMVVGCIVYFGVVGRVFRICTAGYPSLEPKCREPQR